MTLEHLYCKRIFCTSALIIIKYIYIALYIKEYLKALYNVKCNKKQKQLKPKGYKNQNRQLKIKIKIKQKEWRIKDNKTPKNELLLKYLIKGCDLR